MDGEILGLDLRETQAITDVDWLRQLPDKLLRDPRQWPDLLRCLHPHPRMHSVLWYAALAHESMRRMSGGRNFQGYVSDAVSCKCLNQSVAGTVQRFLQPA